MSKQNQSDQTPGLDIGAIRARLEHAKGPEYWRCLEELAETDGFQDMLHREFPRQATEWEDADGRRNFLKLMGASLALAGLGACTRQPTEFVMPYVTAPEQLIPGKPQFYATAVTLSGVATGVLMESNMGRPTKVEGNPQHPASLGSTDAITQASVLTLYDPDRSQSINYLGEIRTFASFLSMTKEALRDQIAKGGSGIRILTETITSPSLGAQIQDLLTQFPGAKWHQWEPLGRGNAREGAKLATGQYVNTTYKFDQADVVLSLDSDFLTGGTVPVRYARDFSSKRKVRGSQATMNRLYAIETIPTSTGGKADHRLAVKPSQMASVVRQVAAAVGAGSASGPATSTRFLTALISDLNAHKGSSLVIAGDDQTPEVHALAHAMNSALGNVGKTVFYTDPIEVKPVDQWASMKELLADLDSGAVDMLFILGGNPVYNAPADFDVKNKLQKAKMRVHLGTYSDETAEICQWHIPESHALESWGDARAYDGTVTIMQPLIAPLYSSSKAANELLGVFTESPEPTSYDLVRTYWQKQHPGGDFETWWRHAVHDGFIANSALPVKTVTAQAPAAPAGGNGGGDLEVSFHADTFLYDGRFANNGWLMELPRPVSKLTWDNAALISPATAHRLGLQNEDYVELKSGGHTVWAGVWIMPGQPDDSVGLQLGYGRVRAGRVGNGAGFNAFLLRTSNQLSYAPVSLRKLDRKFRLASTQQHYLIEEGKGGELENNEQKKRGILRGGTIAEYLSKPDFAQEVVETPPKGLTIYPETFKYNGYAWGMVIDLTSCTGCGTCTAACQAENNIPVVGKEQVLSTREMHWIRVDRYFSGDMESPSTHFQPVPCMHCENAPCELVCPVAATVTDQDGLNNMIYNRCVGTRYCSNNCPYKVRRFNFMRFSDLDTESLKMVRNPDVTVRTRGVIEKCSYCIQRIAQAKITAEQQDRRVQEGEVVTACQAACPTQAIIFGDINDPKSEVARLRKEKLNYGMLADLNTRPRTTYLAELRNPNPELQPASGETKS